MKPASPGQFIVLGDNSRVPATDIAEITIKMGTYKSKVECLVVEKLAGYPLILGNPWLLDNNADMSFLRKQVVLQKPNGQQICLNAIQKKTTESENYLGLLGEGHLYKMGTYNSTVNLLSTKKVVRMIKKDQLTDAFLLLVQEDNSLHEITDNSSAETVDIYAELIPGNTAPERELRDLLLQYEDIFKTELPGINSLKNMRSVIPLVPDAVIPNRPMFRYSQGELAEMQTQVAELLRQGLIQKSKSPFGAPVLFVKKKTGEMRMCVDYRALNKVTIANRYPLPRIDDLLDKMQGATVFSTLDLLSAYHQIKLTDEDIPKSAFRTPKGLYEYKVMPFGLTNAPSVFMAAMNDILADFGFVAVYLDDILIFSKTPEEHVKHVREVFEKLESSGFYLKLKKCEFFKSSVPYLGHVISSEGIRPDPKKVSAVENWPTPQSVFDVRSFLGLANYFRRYIHNFSKHAAPMIELTKGNVSKRKSVGVKIAWNDECQKGFDTLKKALTSAETLRIPDFNKPFQLITDASDFALGGILLQDSHPIAYESRILNGAERNYMTTDKELLAVIHACKVWRCYLEGTSFTVLTDHNPLTYFPTKPLMSQRQVRWSEFLSNFALKWEFIPGKDNPADSLSRLCIMTSTRVEVDKSIHAKRWHKQHIGGASSLGEAPIENIQLLEIKKAY